MSLIFDFAAGQLLGDREHQNDSYGTSAHGVFVADGAGADPRSRHMADAVIEVYTTIAETANAQPDAHVGALLVDAPDRFAELISLGSGASTLAGALIDASGLMWLVAHGDSTVMHVRQASLVSMNRPHNLAEELTQRGIAPPVAASARLTRSLSARPEGSSDVSVSRAREGDVIIAMSDGFADRVPLGTVLQCTESGGSADDILEALLDQIPVDAMTSGDNATCAVGVIRTAASQFLDQNETVHE